MTANTKSRKIWGRTVCKRQWSSLLRSSRLHCLQANGSTFIHPLVTYHENIFCRAMVCKRFTIFPMNMPRVSQVFLDTPYSMQNYTHIHIFFCGWRVKVMGGAERTSFVAPPFKSWLVCPSCCAGSSDYLWPVSNINLKKLSSISIGKYYMYLILEQSFIEVSRFHWIFLLTFIVFEDKNLMLSKHRLHTCKAKKYGVVKGLFSTIIF